MKSLLLSEICSHQEDMLSSVFASEVSCECEPKSCNMSASYHVLFRAVKVSAQISVPSMVMVHSISQPMREN